MQGTHAMLMLLNIAMLMLCTKHNYTILLSWINIKNFGHLSRLNLKGQCHGSTAHPKYART
jgi:hypothetical protein